jgi:hypothetical protein
MSTKLGMRKEITIITKFFPLANPANHKIQTDNKIILLSYIPLG